MDGEPRQRVERVATTVVSLERGKEARFIGRNERRRDTWAEYGVDNDSLRAGFGLVSRAGSSPSGDTESTARFPRVLFFFSPLGKECADRKALRSPVFFRWRSGQRVPHGGGEGALKQLVWAKLTISEGDPFETAAKATKRLFQQEGGRERWWWRWWWCQERKGGRKRWGSRFEKSFEGERGKPHRQEQRC